MKRYNWMGDEHPEGAVVLYSAHVAEAERRVREERGKKGWKLVEGYNFLEKARADERESIIKEMEAWVNNTESMSDLIQRIRSRSGDSAKPIEKINTEMWGPSRQVEAAIAKGINELIDHVRALEERGNER